MCVWKWSRRLDWQTADDDDWPWMNMRKFSLIFTCPSLCLSLSFLAIHRWRLFPSSEWDDLNITFSIYIANILSREINLMRASSTGLGTDISHVDVSVDALRIIAGLRCLMIRDFEMGGNWKHRLVTSSKVYQHHISLRPPARARSLLSLSLSLFN